MEARKPSHRVKADDWSSVTPHALQFLTGESVPAATSGSNPTIGLIRHSSRRLVCPRPFVDSRPRIHQWCWLLAPPGSNCTDSQLVERFRCETNELAELFAEWVRAPRGLGGLADSLWLVTTASVGRPGRRKMDKLSAGKSAKQSGVDDESDDGSDSAEMEDRRLDSEDEQKRLRIVADDSGSEGDYSGGQKKAKRKPVKSRLDRPQTTHILDDSIPPPLYPTTWRLRPFTEEQRRQFQMQEAERFSRPWASFVYRIQDYASVVGPLRSAPSASNQRAPLVARSYPMQSRAREHPLLRPDRPNFVSLAEIVRDAVACLPNGEGTRADITTLVQNSGYLLPSFDQRKLQQCVSSALDRLQGEAADPSVYFNVNRRMWIYRHRHRTVEEFELGCAMLMFFFSMRTFAL
ncbi:unnamed protein product [Echinostoma caproni]|uniref:NFRKB winged helix-like domain-containing protein n=1 Tax=Echinostoma caproni TaxID=27848 RepID=A0A183BAI0_9TREM|nr:unnamed protein product [Echinostoma caproni]